MTTHQRYDSHTDDLIIDAIISIAGECNCAESHNKTGCKFFNTWSAPTKKQREKIDQYIIKHISEYAYQEGDYIYWGSSNAEYDHIMDLQGDLIIWH